MEGLSEFPVYRQQGRAASAGATSYLAYTLIFTILINLFEIYVQYRQYLQFRYNDQIHEKLLSIEGIQVLGLSWSLTGA